MADSMLGKFVRSIRLKNGISDIKAAFRLDISVKKYLQIESHPEKVDEVMLNKIFTVLSFSREEVLEYEKFKAFYLDNKKIKKISILKSAN